MSELKPWTYCPECGSGKNERASDFPVTHRCCVDCGQEWHRDIDYTDVVRGHLSRHPAPDSVKAPASPHWVELARLVASSESHRNPKDAYDELREGCRRVIRMAQQEPADEVREVNTK